MTSTDHTSVPAPMIKIFTAWAAAIGLQTWGDLASFLAACYTAILIAEWVHNRFFKPKKTKE